MTSRYPPPFPAADLHCDTASLMIKGYDFSGRNETHHADLPRLKEAGIRLQVFACFNRPHFWLRDYRSKTLAQISALINQIKRNNTQMALALSRKDLDGRNGKVIALIGIEGAHHLNNSLDAMDDFWQQGARIFTLTWNNSNFLATSNKDQNQDKIGLTPAGKEAVIKMNRLGIAIDLSHAGTKTFRDVLELSEKPAFASHSCSHALCPISRNLSDEQAKALAAKGGIIGINFYRKFLRKKLWKNAGIEEVSLHILHFCNLVGYKHVALGADYDGMKYPAIGLDDVSCLPRLSEYFLSKGLSEQDIRSIFYDNAIRYLKGVLP